MSGDDGIVTDRLEPLHSLACFSTNNHHEMIALRLRNESTVLASMDTFPKSRREGPWYDRAFHLQILQMSVTSYLSETKFLKTFEQKPFYGIFYY